MENWEEASTKKAELEWSRTASLRTAVGALRGAETSPQFPVDLFHWRSHPSWSPHWDPDSWPRFLSFREISVALEHLHGCITVTPILTPNLCWLYSSTSPNHKLYKHSHIAPCGKFSPGWPYSLSWHWWYLWSSLIWILALKTHLNYQAQLHPRTESRRASHPPKPQRSDALFSQPISTLERPSQEAYDTFSKAFLLLLAQWSWIPAHFQTYIKLAGGRGRVGMVVEYQRQL